jgi:hypothetical protein
MERWFGHWWVAMEHFRKTTLSLGASRRRIRVQTMIAQLTRECTAFLLTRAKHYTGWKAAEGAVENDWHPGRTTIHHPSITAWGFIEGDGPAADSSCASLIILQFDLRAHSRGKRKISIPACLHSHGAIQFSARSFFSQVILLNNIFAFATRHQNCR